MKRRHLLKYGTFAACGYGLAACETIPSVTRPKKTIPTEASPLTVKIDGFRTPEKKKLALGYAPTIAVTPWLVAQEQGFFEQFDLEVSFYKQPDMKEVERGLLESRFDAAITPFSLPLINQLKTPSVNFQALMQVHRHGGVFTMGEETWDARVRSSFDYTNFGEFARAYRTYVRSLPEPTFGVDDLYSVPAYLYRYWWAAIGFHPELDLNLLEFSPSQLPYKLRANAVQGYCSQEPWAQEAIYRRQGYIGYLSGEIWRGHPGSVVTVDKGWVKENPHTAKALTAATLLGCHYCQNPSNAQAIAALMSEPLDTHRSNIETLFNGRYFYGGSGDRPIQRKDNPIWFDLGRRLTAPDHANYCWQSHGTWLLTQMTRWQHFGLHSYPDNAEALVKAAYPNAPYDEVAKAFSITLPSDSDKQEPVFIDQRRFDAEQPVRYLNQFKIRT